jgi:hypothetical protein
VNPVVLRSVVTLRVRSASEHEPNRKGDVEMFGRNLHWKVMGLGGSALLLCGAPLLVGCSSGTQASAGAGGTPTTSASTSAASRKAGPGTPTDRGTPEGAVATWVTAIIEGDQSKLCSAMVNPSAPGSAASPSASTQPVSPQECATGAPQILKVYRPMLTPKGATGSPKVNVGQVTASGNSITIPARDVHINGKPLREILMANSVGLTQSQQKQQKFFFNTSKIGSSWYVTGIDGI